MQATHAAATPRSAEPAGDGIQINAQVPDFTADTTHGPLTFSEWQSDRWVVFFSHPADFTPVCTTELIALARLGDQFQQRNAALLGSSVDSVYSHIAWLQNIRERFGVDVDFPIIADLDMRVAKLYGMIHEASSDTTAIRSVYFIDPRRVLRAIICYPMNVGRSSAEILRVLDALQTTDEYGVSCPADWQRGDDVFVEVPRTKQEAEKRLAAEDYEITDWYFSKQRI